MPATNRPGKTPHTRLRRLRKICGLTQEALAQRIGLSYGAIISIETGALALSRKAAIRIALATGVTADSLLVGPTLRPQPELRGDQNNAEDPEIEEDAPDAEFTLADFTTHSARIATRPRPDVEDVEIFDEDRLDNARLRFLELSALFEAAWYANCFDQVLFLFYEWMLETIDALDLEAPVLQARDTHSLRNQNFLFSRLVQQMERKAQERHEKQAKTKVPEPDPRNYSFPPPKSWESKNSRYATRPLWADTPSKSAFGEWLRRIPLKTWLYKLRGEENLELKADWEGLWKSKCPICVYSPTDGTVTLGTPRVDHQQHEGSTQTEQSPKSSLPRRASRARGNGEKAS